MQTVQTNVRVAESDKRLVIEVAQRLRGDAGFRARLEALLQDRASAGQEERIKKLEQQVNWLLSGAIIVPRAPVRPLQPTGALKLPGASSPGAAAPPRAGADHD